MGKFKNFANISLLLFNIIITVVTIRTRTTFAYHLVSCMGLVRVFLWFLLSSENRVRVTEGNNKIIDSLYPVFVSFLFLMEKFKNLANFFAIG